MKTADLLMLLILPIIITYVILERAAPHFPT